MSNRPRLALLHRSGERLGLTVSLTDQGGGKRRSGIVWDFKRPQAGVSVREGDHAMTIAEIAVLSVLIGSVVVSVWLGFLHREF